jgi:4-amino-4-deoxy-L-arabinose transferase-like glycosyltransferase
VACPRPPTTRLPLVAESLVVLLLVLTLRLPSLFEPHHYGDEGVFAATAQRLLDGEALYTGAWDNKPPLIFLVYAVVLAVAGPSMAALRLVGILVTVGTALAVLAIGRRTGGEAVGWLAALLYAVLASLPFVEGSLLLTEHLMVMPAAIAVLLVLSATESDARTRDARLLAAGALFGIAFLGKQVAALDAAAAGLWLLCLRPRPLRDAALLTAGWLVLIAVASFALAASGALPEAWRAVFGAYGIYLGEGSAVPAGFKVLRLFPAALALGLLLWRRRHSKVSASDLVLLWLVFSLFGATLAGRPFGHYLIPVLPPFAIILADLTPQPPSLKGDRGVRSAVLILTLITAIAGFRGFWFSHPTLTPAYYGNWLAWAAGFQSREEHDRFYSWRVPNQDALARLIEDGGNGRTLYVWGEYPWLYPLTGTHNPSRFSTSYQTSILPGAKTETLADLERDPPRYIALELEEWRRLPGLAVFLAARYERIVRVDNTELWRLRDS